MLAVIEAASFLSLYVGAAAAVAVSATLGVPLGMYGQMWLAGNPEPSVPTSPYPWPATALLALLPLPLAAAGRWRYAALATVPLVVLPSWHLVRLYAEAGRP